tara:strand:+ start:107 stop:1048 length:942 start_codon:yes stop_codon:yes gene_type:complete
MQYKILPGHLYPKGNQINLYYFHNLLKVIGESVALQLNQQHKINIPITTGMWGGSYMVAQDDGQAKTNVVRLYSIVNLPQNTSLNRVENFECLMEIYQQTLHTAFKRYGLNLVEPRWGEAIPYSNRELPTTALQMWDNKGKANFLRVFFVWNEATWEESIIYDMIRNIKVLKELLNINTRPQKKESSELKFLLQDVLITYFTLQAALTADFLEHAEPIINKLFNQFINGMHSEEIIEEQYHKVYSNALVYGFEEALQVHYKKKGLDIQKVEEWPVNKINYVPNELKEKLVPALQAPWKKFHANLEKQTQVTNH